MTTPRRPPSWRRFFRVFDGDADHDVDAELDFHLEERVAEYVRQGVPPSEARERASARFGDRTAARIATLDEDRNRDRRQRQLSLFRGLGQDARFAMRTLRRQKLPAGLAVLCVALGIGATTSVLSVADALLLRPLPFPNGAGLVQIGTESPGEPLSASAMNSFEDYTDWRQRQRSLADLAAVSSTTVTLGATQPVRAAGASSTASLWPVLGVRPLRGRLYGASDEAPGAPRVVVVSAGFAQRTLAGVDSAVGKQLTLDGRVHDVIGVISNEWRFPEGTEMWMPLPAAPDPQRRGNRWLTVVASLRPDGSLEAARTDLGDIAAALAREIPQYNASRRVAIAPLRDRYVGSARERLAVAGVAAMLVLLIACANVACLQLARGSARMREIAMRMALGASRGRIIRQLLTENVVLALAGGILGVALGIWGSTGAGRAIAANAPLWMTFSVNVPVLVVATVVCVGAGILFGIIPALGLTRGATAPTLRAGGSGNVERAQGFVQRALAVFELALTVVLVTSATLAVESFVRLSRVQPGFDVDGVRTFRLTLTGPRYDSSAARRATVAAIVEGLKGLPGVAAATAASHVPLRDCCSRFGVTPPSTAVGVPAGNVMITGNIVDADYFTAMRIPVVRGRGFTAEDRAETDGVIAINETMATQFWPGENAVGRTVNVGSGSLRVVGVIANVKQTSLVEPAESQFYRPHAQEPWEVMTFVTRMHPGATISARDLRAPVHAADPTIAVGGVLLLRDIVDRALSPRRVFGTLFVIFGGVALALALAGIYGVLAFQVSRRRREIGVRIAMGAQRATVLRLVLWQATKLSALGVGIGIVGALAAARVLSHTLYGVHWETPWRYAGVVALLVLATLGAALGPAWRASRVDPIETLRAD